MNPPNRRLRFYLDHDVSALVKKPFRDLGHDAWTANESGLATSSDVDQMEYAIRKDAIVVTHDAGFASRERKRTTGRLVHLDVRQPEAPRIVSDYLPHAVLFLARHDVCVVTLRQDGVRLQTGRWPKGHDDD